MFIFYGCINGYAHIKISPIGAVGSAELSLFHSSTSLCHIPESKRLHVVNLPIACYIGHFKE